MLLHHSETSIQYYSPNSLVNAKKTHLEESFLCKVKSEKERNRRDDTKTSLLLVSSMSILCGSLEQMGGIIDQETDILKLNLTAGGHCSL